MFTVYHKISEDKITILKIVDNQNNEFELYKLFGKRGNIRGRNLQSSIKGTFPSFETANIAFNKEHTKLVNNGYVNIQESIYTGAAKIDEFKKYFPKDRNISVKEVFLKEVVQEETVKEIVVECVDNIGVHDLYDIGVTYIAKEITRVDGKELQVEDRFGKLHICRESRFIEVNED